MNPGTGSKQRSTAISRSFTHFENYFPCIIQLMKFLKRRAFVNVVLYMSGKAHGRLLEECGCFFTRRADFKLLLLFSRASHLKC